MSPTRGWMELRLPKAQPSLRSLTPHKGISPLNALWPHLGLHTQKTASSPQTHHVHLSPHHHFPSSNWLHISHPPPVFSKCSRKSEERLEGLLTRLWLTGRWLMGSIQPIGAFPLTNRVFLKFSLLRCPSCSRHREMHRTLLLCTLPRGWL